MKLTQAYSKTSSNQREIIEPFYNEGSSVISFSHPKSRALSKTVDDVRRPLLAYANGEIESHVWFKDAFSNKDLMITWMQEAWQMAQIEVGLSYPSNLAVEQHVKAHQNL